MSMTVDAGNIIDGKALAAALNAALAAKVNQLLESGQRPPGLAVILVGDNPASQAYVATKEKVAKAVGFVTFETKLLATCSASELSDAILDYNVDNRVDGILLQLPLPKGLDSAEMLNLINPKKDADGLHPLNQGLLVRGSPAPRPCTPLGVMKLIDLAFHNGQISGDIPCIDLAGKKAVVIGRSVLVGKPQAMLLLERNATVTMAHSKSPDLPAICRDADILVAAVGVPGLVRADWVKQGAIVIDVGINRLADGRLTGDVAFEEVARKARAITPVPGGAGPMTVAMLMHNTWLARVASDNTSTRVTSQHLV